MKLIEQKNILQKLSWKTADLELRRFRNDGAISVSNIVPLLYFSNSNVIVSYISSVGSYIFSYSYDGNKWRTKNNLQINFRIMFFKMSFFRNYNLLRRHLLIRVLEL